MAEYDYKDKFGGNDGRRSILDILSLSDDALYSSYRAEDIDKVIIEDKTFSSYGAYQFLREKSYITSPTRSENGSIPDINEYPFFVTPHLIMNFSLMSIDDYREIMKLIYEKNEFTVKCYDHIYNKVVTEKMYFATEEMAKLYTINKVRLNEDKWEDWIALVGVEEYTVELIGTNNPIE